MNHALPEEAVIVTVLAPAADAAGRVGAAFSCKGAHKVTLMAVVAQGNAAPVTFTPEQCTAVSGAGNKAIPAVPIYANQDEASSVVARIADAVAAVTDAGLKNKKILFDIDPSKLDIANGYDCLRCSTSASNAANITAIYAILWPVRYAGQSMPNALAN